jgi:hypothetical protein
MVILHAMSDIYMTSNIKMLFKNYDIAKQYLLLETYSYRVSMTLSKV